MEIIEPLGEDQLLELLREGRRIEGVGRGRPLGVVRPVRHGSSRIDRRRATIRGVCWRKDRQIADKKKVALDIVEGVRERRDSERRGSAGAENGGSKSRSVS